MTVSAIGPPRDALGLTGSSLCALREVRLPDDTVGDVLIGPDGVTAAPGSPLGPGVELNARGWRVFPAPAEPHAHLDKALTAPRLATSTGSAGGAGIDTGNDLRAAIAQWHALAPAIDAADVHARALAAVRRYLAHGITAIRSHVNLSEGGDPFAALDALVALREQLRGRVILQVCLLPGSADPEAVVAEALTRGVDVLGGCPHLCPDPEKEIDRLLDLAERHRLPVDLHCDEQLTTDLADDQLDVVALARQVLRRGLPGPVTASHAVRLGMLEPDRLDPVVELLARAGIGVVTLPITNLYLMGREATHARPRGLTALRALLDAGVTLAAGADNLRDPFNPVGRADPFETTSLLMTAGQLTAAEALHAVTAGARAVLGLPDAGTAPGQVVDLVLVPDTDRGEVLAGGVTDRIVLHGGRVVAVSRTSSRVDLDLDQPAAERPAPIEVSP